MKQAALRTEDRTTAEGGKYKVVERWVVVHAINGKLATNNSGQHTYATEEEAKQHIAAALKNNDAATIAEHYGQGLRAARWWCYAGHFDPIGPSSAEPTAILIEHGHDKSHMKSPFFRWSLYPSPGKEAQHMGTFNTEEEAQEHAREIFGACTFHKRPAEK